MWVLGFFVVEHPTSQAPNAPAATDVASRYPHVLDYLLSAPWAITPEKMRAIADVVVHRAFVGELPREAIAAAVAQRPTLAVAYAMPEGLIPAEEVFAAGGRPPTGAKNITAIVPVMGTILPRASAMDESSGMFSLATFRQTLRALVADPDVSAIVMQIDSPGGSVAHLQETSAEIRAARAKKPIGAIADVTAASAAYQLFTQATPGLQFVTPSGQVGSVGVLSMHEDVSRALEAKGVTVSLITSEKAPFKAETFPYRPLTDEARAEVQRVVDSYHQDFRQAIAQGRRITVAQVDEQFGGGRMVRAKDAVARGMADEVGTLEDLLRAVQSHAAGGSRERAEIQHDHAPTSARVEEPAQPVDINVDALGAALAAGLAQRKD